MEFGNPYQAPQNPEPAQANIYVNDRFLLMPKNTSLPERCLKCSEPPAKRYTQKLFWVSPWVYLCFLINILVLLIVYLVTRKTTAVSYSLCARHAKEKRMRNWTLAGFGAGIILFLIACAALESIVPLWLAIASMVAMIIFSLVKPLPLTVKKFEKNQFWIKGAGDEMLTLFPKITDAEVAPKSPSS
ncbi:hypothetical protein [Alcanivorax sp. DP30]|uniref:hypothetical protein n=1 Tax=Alcanivorax sp. DP30 TaxID=2606217 RepID=UPI00137219CD|nr:hypothetical protein [Alcanivorax sp. DP30]MZR63191.1 hypothetical protein [Alcanivorax sp. DP30]